MTSYLRVYAETGYLKIYDARKTLNELASQGVDVSIASGLVNSVIQRCRGPLPSEAFLLTDRESLEKYAPDLFSESKGQGSFTDSQRFNYGTQASFLVYVNNGDLSTYVNGLVPINVHCLSSVKKPNGYQTYHDANEIDKDSPSWSFRKQIYFVHLADARYFLCKQNQRPRGTDLTAFDNYGLNGFDIIPRPFTVGTEDLSQTNQTDELFWKRSDITLDSSGFFAFMRSLSKRTFTGSDGREYQTDPLLNLTSDGHMLPTTFNNAQVLEEGPYKTIWSLLSEVSHTITFDNAYAGGCDLIAGKVAEMGDTSSSTLSTERSTYSPYLLSTSNDGGITFAPKNYRVFFPQTTDSNPAVYTYKFLSSSEKFIDVSSSSLGVSYDSSEIANTTQDLRGRIVFRRGQGGFYNEAQVNTHAQELAKLHLKKKLFEARNCFFREEYSGFCLFTKGNKDLSSIAWVSTGQGPKTIISCTPFDLDSIDPLPIDRLRKNNTITIPVGSQKLPHDFFDQVSFTYQVQSAWANGTDRAISKNVGKPSVQSIIRADNSITATNDSGDDLDADDIVTVYWDKDAHYWRISVAAKYALE